MINLDKVKGTGGGSLGQRIARSRNYFKFIISSVGKQPIDRTCLTEHEKKQLDNILSSSKSILNNFETTSKIITSLRKNYEKRNVKDNG